MALKIGDRVLVSEPGLDKFEGYVIAVDVTPFVLVERLIPASIPIPDRNVTRWVKKADCQLTPTKLI